MSKLRNPLVSIGFLLVLLGAGNWYIGANKLARYEGVLTEQHGSAPPVEHEEFSRLTAAMNANLLRKLRAGSGEYQRTQAKIDFYRVTLFGGRTMILFGMTCVTMGVLRRRRQRLALA